MTCPNAFLGVDGQCAGRGWIIHRSQPVPCPSCWRVAGYRLLTQRQGAQLRRYHVLLVQLGQSSLLDDVDEVSRWFDDACAQLRVSGVTDEVRDAWVRWLDQRGAEVKP